LAADLDGRAECGSLHEGRKRKETILSPPVFLPIHSSKLQVNDPLRGPNPNISEARNFGVGYNSEGTKLVWNALTPLSSANVKLFVRKPSTLSEVNSSETADV
jgi:hypothetical protein